MKSDTQSDGKNAAETFFKWRKIVLKKERLSQQIGKEWGQNNAFPQKRKLKGEILKPNVEKSPRKESPSAPLAKEKGAKNWPLAKASNQSSFSKSKQRLESTAEPIREVGLERSDRKHVINQL